MTFTAQATIARPPEEVFDLMADARNEPHWNSKVTRSTLDSGEPVGPGSRFTTVNRGRPYAATITTYERPTRLVFDVTGSGMDITATFRLSPEGAGTRLESAFDFRPKGLMKVMYPALKGAIAKDVPRQAASFNAFCENAAG